MTGYTILRLDTPLDETGLDFMMNKLPFAKVLELVSDLSRDRSKSIRPGLVLDAG